jgi:hypothetical protein
VWSDASLPVIFAWLNNGEQINFEAKPRFVLSSECSLTLTEITEDDSGTYTPVAEMALDEISAQATLIVLGTIFFPL